MPYLSPAERGELNAQNRNLDELLYLNLTIAGVNNPKLADFYFLRKRATLLPQAHLPKKKKGGKGKYAGGHVDVRLTPVFPEGVRGEGSIFCGVVKGRQSHGEKTCCH